jgi:hypothetical protein
MNQWKELDDAEVLLVADQLARRVEGTHDEHTLRVALLNELSRRNLASQFDLRRLKVVSKPEYLSTTIRYEGKPRIILLGYGLSEIALLSAKTDPGHKVFELNELLHLRNETKANSVLQEGSSATSARAILRSVFEDTPNSVSHLHLNAVGSIAHPKVLNEVFGALNEHLPKWPTLKICVVHGFGVTDAQKAIDEQQLKIAKGATTLPIAVFID